MNVPVSVGKTKLRKTKGEMCSSVRSLSHSVFVSFSYFKVNFVRSIVQVYNYHSGKTDRVPTDISGEQIFGT